MDVHCEKKRMQQTGTNEGGGPEPAPRPHDSFGSAHERKQTAESKEGLKSDGNDTTGAVREAKRRKWLPAKGSTNESPKKWTKS